MLKGGGGVTPVDPPFKSCQNRTLLCQDLKESVRDVLQWPEDHPVVLRRQRVMGLGFLGILGCLGFRV